MNVLELRKLIAGAPDDADIIIWVSDLNDLNEWKAVDVHDFHLSGRLDAYPDQTPAVHLRVLV